MKRKAWRKNDNEMVGSHKVQFYRVAGIETGGDQRVVEGGVLLFCEAGDAVVRVNFGSIRMTKGSVAVLFPNDVVLPERFSADFVALVLRYDAAILREASLQLEQTVYSHLRANRHLEAGNPLSVVAGRMLSVLEEYFAMPDCSCLEQVVLLQLKTFFIGYHEHLRHLPAAPVDAGSSRRKQELFDNFMLSVENRHREMRDVQSYANHLNISPKYLNIIVRRMTGHSAKVVIDHFVTLQLKMELRKSSASVKEIAQRYNFSDLSFFCRYFKQHTGMSPQAFRRMPE